MNALVPAEDQPPYLFDEFVDSGYSDEASPFLTHSARRWAFNLDLRSSLFAAILLTISFPLSFVPGYLPIAHLLLLLVYFLAGIPALIESVEDLLDLEVNIDVLMTLAAFSSVLIGSQFEGALLLVLFSISGSLEHTVTQQAKGTLSSLRRLAPATAKVIRSDGNLMERSVKDIRPGTKILIRAGEVVPLDGLVIEGASSLNLVHLTGESLPVPIAVGESASAGAQNLDGALTLEVTASSSDSSLARIIRLVTQAQEARPNLQRWFDRLSKGYATSIIAFSFSFALLYPLLVHIPFLGTHGSIYRALSFLIAASPCALILAIPITYMSAVSSCARKGILLKGGITLDALASCSILAFDKTGTLTTGNLHCNAFFPLDEPNQEVPKEVIAIAAGLERNAVHPIAQAILDYADNLKIGHAPLTEFRSVPGQGLTALYQETEVKIGRPEFIASHMEGPRQAFLIEKAAEVKRHGESLTILMVGEEVYLLTFKDTLRPQVKETLVKLKKGRKMRLLMLTGDHVESARGIAEELGLSEFHSDLRPEDKMEIISNLSAHDGLAMVGDGINDAPALARATCGIAMGQVGSASAMEASDIILLRDELPLLDGLVGKARLTQRIVKQNLGLAFGAIIIASSAALMGLIPLWLAVLMHEGGTVLVGLNGLRLLRD